MSNNMSDTTLSPQTGMHEKVHEEMHEGDTAAAVHRSRGESVVIGKHVYGNLYGVPYSNLTDLERLTGTVKEAAIAGKAHIVDMLTRKFLPLNGLEGGVSIIAMLEESHISLHTWPEGSYATLDVYTCGREADPDAVFSYMVKEMKPKRFKLFRSDRSLVSERIAIVDTKKGVKK